MSGILSIQEDSRLPSPVLARELLEKLVAVTAKACERNNLTVLRLEEFYPPNRSLLGLNINAGEKIKIRLREGYDAREFLPWPSILGTMVHELTHNMVGSHSAEFYEEMERLHSEIDIDRVSEANTYNPYRNKRKQYNFEGPYHVLGAADVKRLSSRWTDSKYCLPSKDIFMSSAGAEEYNQLNLTDRSCSIVSSKNPANFNATNSDAELVPISWKCDVCTELNDAREVMVSNRNCNAQEQNLLIVACLFCGCNYGSMIKDDSDAHAPSRNNSSDQSDSRKRTCIIDLTLDSDAATAVESVGNDNSTVMKPIGNINTMRGVALKRHNVIASTENRDVSKKICPDSASYNNSRHVIDLTH